METWLAKRILHVVQDEIKSALGHTSLKGEDIREVASLSATHTVAYLTRLIALKTTATE